MPDTLQALYQEYRTRDLWLYLIFDGVKRKWVEDKNHLVVNISGFEERMFQKVTSELRAERRKEVSKARRFRWRKSFLRKERTSI